jgi:hypothetical protein
MRATSAAVDVALLPASVVPILGQALRILKTVGEVALTVGRAASNSMEH